LSLFFFVFGRFLHFRSIFLGFLPLLFGFCELLSELWGLIAATGTKPVAIRDARKSCTPDV
jgi:hypothetical protein